MKTWTAPVHPEGPLIELAVGLSYPDAHAQRQAGKPVPTPVIVQALIDTGAEMSAVDSAALVPLLAVGIPPLNFVFVNLPAAGTAPVPVYPVSLAIGAPVGAKPASVLLRDLPVTAQDLAVLGYQAVLGRDVLAGCLLIYDGPSGTYTLGY